MVIDETHGAVHIAGVELLDKAPQHFLRRGKAFSFTAQSPGLPLLPPLRSSTGFVLLWASVPTDHFPPGMGADVEVHVLKVFPIRAFAAGVPVFRFDPGPTLFFTDLG